jgi:hypothetical protein
MFTRFCGFGPGHKATRKVTKVFRDDIKEAFGLADGSEALGDDAEEVELEIPGDGARDMELDDDEEDCEDDVVPDDIDSEGSEDDNWDEVDDEDEDDGDLDGLVDGLGYGAL